MPRNRNFRVSLLSLSLVIAACGFAPSLSYGQGYGGGAPQVSMVALQTMAGEGGQQMVLTPKGYVVPLPGPGVNGPSVEIYMGSNGGWWYVDKNGQTVDLTPAVAQYRAKLASIGQTMNLPTQPVPQYAPAPTQIINNNYESAPSEGSSSGSSGGGGSALGGAALSATAAGLGAMAGAAMGSSWNNVPYGAPMYYGGAGHAPYYYNNGKPVYINNSTKNFNNANVNAANVNRTNYNQANFNQANVNKANFNQANLNQANMNRANANSFDSDRWQQNMSKQQDWYKNQAKQNPEQFNNWKQQKSGENPFARSESGGQGRFSQNAQAGSGRFGGAEGAGGGRFGGAQGGGRFAGRGGGRRR